MSIPTSVTLYQLNNQYVEIQGLKDVITGLFLNTETVTATLFDSTGVAVTGLSALAMPFEAASSGNYRGQISGTTFNPPLGTYSLKITSTNGFLLTLKVKVAIRKT
jgi:hypothetical protein